MNSTPLQRVEAQTMAQKIQELFRKLSQQMAQLQLSFVPSMVQNTAAFRLFNLVEEAPAQQLQAPSRRHQQCIAHVKNIISEQLLRAILPRTSTSLLL